jgi:hypothetical protein
LPQDTLTLMRPENFLEQLFADGTNISIINVAVSGNVDVANWMTQTGQPLKISRAVSLTNVQIQGVFSLAGIQFEQKLELTNVKISGETVLEGVTSPLILLHQCRFYEEVRAKNMSGDRIVFSENQFKADLIANGLTSPAMTWHKNTYGTVQTNELDLFYWAVADEKGFIGTFPIGAN